MGKLFKVLGDSIMIFEKYESRDAREKASMGLKKARPSGLASAYILLDRRVQELPGMLSGIGPVGDTLGAGMTAIAISKAELDVCYRRISRMAMSAKWRDALFRAHGITMIGGLLYDRKEALFPDEQHGTPIDEEKLRRKLRQSKESSTSAPS